MKWFLYILFCDQKTFYVGITNALKERILKHKNKQVFFTKKFSDIKFIYYEKYPDKYVAAKREKQIKGWTRIKKIKLIKGEL